MIASTLRDETADVRELALDDLDQVTGGAGTAGGAGPAPFLSFLIATTAYLGICLGAGYVLGHIIKGDE